MLAGERKRTSEETASAEAQTPEQPVLCGWSVESWDWGVCGGGGGWAEEMGPHRDRNGSCGIVYVSSCKERGPREMVSEGWSQVALLIREIAGRCDPNGWDPSPAELVKFN